LRVGESNEGAGGEAVGVDGVSGGRAAARRVRASAAGVCGCAGDVAGVVAELEAVCAHACKFFGNETGRQLEEIETFVQRHEHRMQHFHQVFVKLSRSGAST